MHFSLKDLCPDSCFMPASPGLRPIWKHWHLITMTDSPLHKISGYSVLGEVTKINISVSLFFNFWYSLMSNNSFFPPLCVQVCFRPHPGMCLRPSPWRCRWTGGQEVSGLWLTCGPWGGLYTQQSAFLIGKDRKNKVRFTKEVSIPETSVLSVCCG